MTAPVIIVCEIGAEIRDQVFQAEEGVHQPA